MNLRLVRGLGLLAAVLFLTGCFTDAATRLWPMTSSPA